MPKLAPRRLAFAAAALGIGSQRNRMGLPPTLSTALVGCAPLVVAAGISSGRLRRTLTWGAQMWAYKIAFEAPHDNRERLRRRLRIDYPIRLDSALFGGTPPGERLQRRLRRPPRISRLDKGLAALYATWDLQPHLILLYLLLRRPDDFPRAAARLAATFDATLIGYWAVPTAPPWWASEKAGRMNAAVRRVAVETKREVRGQDRPISDHEMGANPWAAMPSDHFGTALMTAMILSELGAAPMVGGWLYALSLAFALVYLGEHYVTDLLAGGLLALSVQALSAPTASLIRRIGTAWPQP